MEDFTKRLQEIKSEKAKLDPLRPDFCKTKTDWAKLLKWWELTKEENKIENDIWSKEQNKDV